MGPAGELTRHQGRVTGRCASGSRVELVCASGPSPDLPQRHDSLCQEPGAEKDRSDADILYQCEDLGHGVQVAVQAALVPPLVRVGLVVIQERRQPVPDLGEQLIGGGSSCSWGSQSSGVRLRGLQAIVMRPAGVPGRLSLGRAARRGWTEGSHRGARSTQPGGY